MKVVVFGGSGKMGAAVAWHLVREADVEGVGLVGRHEESLERVRLWLASAKARSHALDIADRQRTAALMGDYDVGVIALPDRRASYRLVEMAIEAGLDSVDMLEEYHRRPDKYETEGVEQPDGMDLDEYGEWLHQRALETGVTLLSGIGFAPGLSNITVGEGIRKLDHAVAAVARVGGIPSRRAALRHPLRYMITWSFDHVLREYMVKVPVLKGGRVVEVDAGSERESFRFTKLGQDETLECAITPGMPSFLYTRPQLLEFAEKTVRWPGHWQGVEILRECGLLDLQPIEVAGTAIRPREFLLAVVEPRLRPLEGDTDVCVMWNTVRGTKNGRPARVDYYLWDEADTENGISSMARVTGFSAAIGALFLGRGWIAEKGIVPPEDGIYGALYSDFIAELEKKGIRVLEEVTLEPPS